MSEEVDKRLYSHYKSLTEGSYKSGNPVRDELVVADAKKHLADLIKKRPDTQFEEAPTSSVSEPSPPPTTSTKPKRKK